MSPRPLQPSRYRTVTAVLLVVAALVALATTEARRIDVLAATQALPAAAVPRSVEEAEVQEVCGTACHRFAPPDVLPRDAWPEEIAKMALFRSGNPAPAGPTTTRVRPSTRNGSTTARVPSTAFPRT